ncbi:hypothetical protein AB1Y20_002592 [Prymnesium parvum]|uniref:Thioredoxin domain-containing protein n=1 Tax=Prymnesium parvum TaxID=97485 RepID=A0AB34JBU3_PRYPA
MATLWAAGGSPALLALRRATRSPPPLTHRACGLLPPRLRVGATRSLSSPAAQAASRRLRSPVTWLSASATLAGLYGMYEYLKFTEMTRQRSTGRPDLGGDFTLVAEDGREVSNQQLMGRWTLLYFGFTKCPDICPEEMHKLTRVLRALDARGVRVQPVFITIDPERDTPARLAEYFRRAGFHEGFLALTGSHEQVRQACRAYRVYYSRPTEEEVKAGDYLLDHSIISYLLDPEGEFADYYGKSLSASEMEERMLKQISDWERERWWEENMPAMLQSTQPPRARKCSPPKGAKA